MNERRKILIFQRASERLYACLFCSAQLLCSVFRLYSTVMKRRAHSVIITPLNLGPYIVVLDIVSDVSIHRNIDFRYILPNRTRFSLSDVSYRKFRYRAVSNFDVSVSISIFVRYSSLTCVRAVMSTLF